MSMALQARISNLEEEVKALRVIVAILAGPADLNASASAAMTSTPANRWGPRQKCPKCHEAPNYHLHVKHCKGKVKAEI